MKVNMVTIIHQHCEIIVLVCTSRCMAGPNWLLYFRKMGKINGEAKREAILFYSEVNSTYYHEFEQPIRVRVKHYSLVWYILITNCYKT